MLRVLGDNAFKDEHDGLSQGCCRGAVDSRWFCLVQLEAYQERLFDQKSVRHAGKGNLIETYVPENIAMHIATIGEHAQNRLQNLELNIDALVDNRIKRNEDCRNCFL